MLVAFLFGTLKTISPLDRLTVMVNISRINGRRRILSLGGTTR